MTHTIHELNSKVYELLGEELSTLAVIDSESFKIGDKVLITGYNYNTRLETGLVCSRYISRIERMASYLADEDFVKVYLVPWQIDSEGLGLSGVQN